MDIHCLQCALGWICMDIWLVLLDTSLNVIEILVFNIKLYKKRQCLWHSWNKQPFPSLSFQSGAQVYYGSAPSLSTSGGRNHTDLRWSTPNQTLPHRPMPPSWASNGSPGHPDASPAPTWASSSALLITGSSRPRSPPFLSLGPAFWEHCGQMCPDEHVLICGPRLMLCQKPRRINSFISLKHRHGENQLTGCF